MKKSKQRRRQIAKAQRLAAKAKADIGMKIRINLPEHPNPPGVNIVAIRNPFDINDREIKEVKFSHTLTLVGYIRQSPIQYDPEDDLVVSVNGGLVDRREWEATAIRPGTYISICPVVHGGGDDGKGVLGIIAGIALSVVTMGVGSVASSGGFWGSKALAMSAWTFGGFMAAAATMFLGGMLISHMMPQPSVDMGSTQQESPTYSWAKLQAMQGQGNPIPITYGTVRSAGQVLAQHVSTDGDKQYLNLLLAAGDGPLDEISEITINDNPAENYSDVQIDLRLGTNDQAAIPNFGDQYADQGLSFELTGNYATQQTDGNANQGLEITIECPGGLYHVNNDGSLADASVTIVADYRIVGAGSWTSWGSWTITDHKQSGVRRAFRLDNLTAGKYEVRVMCSAKSGTTTRDATRVYWTQLTGIMYDDLCRPNRALIGIRALATDQLNGAPSISWIQKRLNVWIYNPNTAAYEQKPANNPAWAAYDLIHRAKQLKNVRTGAYVFKIFGAPAVRIVYQEFADWAQFCTDRGLQVNLILDTAADLWTALREIENVGRGKVVIKGTRFGAICDKPGTPVQMFTMGNIVQGSFKEEYLSVRDRANAIEVTFNNAAKNYERDTITVFGDDWNTTTTVKNPTQITLNGITSWDQAYKEAKYRLRLNKYLIRTVSFEAAIDAIACQVGDVILVQHDVPKWGAGGRLLDVLSTDPKYNGFGGVMQDPILYNNYFWGVASGKCTIDTTVSSPVSGEPVFKQIAANGDNYLIAKDATGVDYTHSSTGKMAVNGGENVVISIWAKGKDGGENIDLFIFSYADTYGGAYITATAASFTLTTSWQRYQYTVKLPSNAKCCWGRFDNNSNTKTVYWAAPQLEIGTTAGIFTSTPSPIRTINRIPGTVNLIAPRQTALTLDTNSDGTPDEWISGTDSNITAGRTVTTALGTKIQIAASTAGGGGAGTWISSQYQIPVIAGQQYTISADVTISGSVYGLFRLTGDGTGGVAASISWTAADIVNGRFIKSFTMPSGFTMLGISLHTRQNSTGSTGYTTYKNLQFEIGSGSAYTTGTRPDQDQVKLDRPVDLDPAKSYELKVRVGSSDQIVTKSVVVPAIATTTDTITLTDTFATPPNTWDVYTFGEVNISAKPFRVVTITRGVDQNRRITALEYIDAVYTEATDVPVIPYTPTGPAPTGLTVTDQLDGSGQTVLLITWRPPRGSFTGYRIEVDGRRIAILGPDQTTYSYPIRNYDTYTIKVTALDGIADLGSVSTTYTPSGAPPADIGTYVVLQNLRQLEHYWTPNVDTAAVEIRRLDPVLLTWESGSVINSGATGTKLVDTNIGEGILYFGIKAIGKNGLYSDNMKMALIQITTVPSSNIIVAVDELTSLDGACVNCFVNGGKITLDVAETWSETNAADTWNEATTTDLWGSPAATSAIYTTQIKDMGKIMTSLVYLELTYPLAYSVEWRYSDTDPTLTGATWQKFIDGGSAKFRYYQVRITLTGDGTVRSVSKFKITVDVPDVVLKYPNEIVTNLAITDANNGVRIDFDQPFFKPPTITGSVLPGPGYIIPESQENYCVIKATTNGSDRITGSLHIQIIGY